MQVLGGQAASKLRTRAASGRTIAMLVWAHAKLKVPSRGARLSFLFWRETGIARSVML